MHRQHTALNTALPFWNGFDSVVDAPTATCDLATVYADVDTVVLSWAAPDAMPLTLPLPLISDPRVLVDSEHTQHLRWRPGERLEQLFEQQTTR
ncbi:MAG: hypothetical protein JOY78_03990, partial [Pseudonocardia sp.]|nr:hypothetical protein [Pseudonocardia sp.]